jgi:hypothetical protein
VDDDRALATALQVVPSPELSLLWSQTVDVLWPDGPEGAPGNPEGIARGLRARDLEILLDVLADAANTAEVPVLAFAPTDLASDREERLSRALTELGACFEGAVPPRVQQLLKSYGRVESTVRHSVGEDVRG